jgi:hypothetical protein
VGTLATDDKQALAEELAEAQALIEAGEYERALDTLDRARSLAMGQREVEGLNYVRAFAVRVRRCAPRGSDSGERADGLLHDTGSDMNLLEERGRQEREAAMAPWSAVPPWCAVVAAALDVIGVGIVVAVLGQADPWGYVHVASTLWLIGGFIGIVGIKQSEQARSWLGLLLSIVAVFGILPGLIGLSLPPKFHWFND